MSPGAGGTESPVVSAVLVTSSVTLRAMATTVASLPGPAEAMVSPVGSVPAVETSDTGAVPVGVVCVPKIVAEFETCPASTSSWVIV